MITRTCIKFLLRSKNKDRTTESVRLLVLKALSSKPIFKNNRPLLIRLALYFHDKKVFTSVQLSCMERICNG